jgi:NAD(P)H-hydrate epimerase
MGRLIGKSTNEVQDDRFNIASGVAERYRCTVLLKGARTLIASPEGRVNLNTTSNPGMATGGAGDVLTGVVAALLALRIDAHEAASAAAYVHGLAGDIVAEDHGGSTGLIATDLIDRLPAAIARCQAE